MCTEVKYNSLKHCTIYTGIILLTTSILAGEFGIVYKGCLAGQYTDEVVAIKTLKGMGIPALYPEY
jgi:hypothetical protein